ncbi:MAG TPA: chromate efflux transporter [bacterium]|nr:chromate efflux transporter [bacterium]
MSHALKEVAAVFLKLGFTAFGGPAAHIALMKEEFVDRRKWLTEERFLDLLGATNLIPGPNSTEMAIHLGHERAGWKGLIIAGCCFIFPAVLITLLFAYLYQRYGRLPEVQPFLYGIKPAIIAVIAAAILPLAKRSITTRTMALLAVTVVLLSLAGLGEIELMFGAGFAAFAFTLAKRSAGTFYAVSPGMLLPFVAASSSQEANLKLFLSFLKIGSILYGSGYVLFAFLETELVVPGLLTESQLIDAVAVGQFTPGPVFSAVTFIGYQINGLTGAALATVGIFLPSFVFVALLNPLVEKIRNSKTFSAFLDAVNVASVALIATVLLSMGKDSIQDWRSALIAVLSFGVVFGFKKLNSAVVIIGGAFTGWLLSFLQF